VDAEIRRILDEQYGVARRILEDRREAVEAMSAALLEWETIDAEQVRAIMEGRKPSPPAGWVEKTARPGKDEDGGPSTAQVVGGPAEQT
jgi:cell division protease FtsH